VDGVCGGCNIAIPPQLYNQLIANPRHWGTCSHCTRMLYYVPPEDASEEDQVESKSA
jgi:predicted  nucleic acid-binding Zn-ribbon protein